MINGVAPESILDTWAEKRRDKWLTYTNQFSIENKRMIQQGGYSDDPLGIWKDDIIAKENGMSKWMELATPGKKDEDEKMFAGLADKDAQIASRMKQWEITMDPRWMEEYEDPAVVEARILLRPKQFVPSL